MNSAFDDHPHPATLQIPSEAADGAKSLVPSTVTGMDGKRLIMESPERVRLSTPVSVEYNDAMFLGEVMMCKPSGDGYYRVEIFVEQILTGLQSLIALRAGLLGETTSTVQPNGVVREPVQVHKPTQHQTKHL